jgi:hypothetical protein
MMAFVQMADLEDHGLVRHREQRLVPSQLFPVTEHVETETFGR